MANAAHFRLIFPQMHLQQESGATDRDEGVISDYYCSVFVKNDEGEHLSLHKWWGLCPDILLLIALSVSQCSCVHEPMYKA